VTPPAPSLGLRRAVAARRLLRGLVVLLLLWGGGAWGLDYWGKTRAAPQAADAIIVAGCHVAPGGVPSVPLAARVREGVELWRRGVAPRIIFTGGVGTVPPSEALVAARYAHSLGLPEEAMVLESESTSTRENAYFARKLTSARNVVVVSDAYHLLRCRLIFGRHFKGVQTAGVLSEPTVRVVGSLREVVSLAWYVVVRQWTEHPDTP